jgi:predicted RNA-binding Zn ribbon-like protein
MSSGLFLCGDRRVLVRGQPEGLCLGFVNTVAWRKAEAPEERLPSPAAFLDWCAGAGVLDAGHAARLRARWEGRPEDARAVHRRALALREAIYEVLRARIASEAIPEAALRVLNAALADAPPRTRLEPGGDALAWSVGSAGPAAPEVLLAPIAWSAADLLAGPRAHRVRQCADERGCGWLFLDESRAGTRRWCSMGECGNRAKARRHYLRGKHSAPGTAGGADPCST